MTAIPLVTLAVTTRNRLGYLGETLAKVREQDYTRLDVLVSDNASDDTVFQQVRALASSDLRFRLRHNDTVVPIHEHFTQCVEDAQGEYFVLLNDDDLINSCFVSKMVEIVTRYPDVNVVVPRNIIINEQGTVIREFPAPKGAVFDGPSFVTDWLYHIEPELLHNVTTILARTNLVKRFGGYQHLTRGQNADNLLFLQCGITSRVGFASEAVFYCRTHSDSLSDGKVWQEVADSGLQFIRHLYRDHETERALRSLPKRCRRRIIDGVRQITARDVIEHMRADPQGFGWAICARVLMRRTDWALVCLVTRERVRAAAPLLYDNLRRIFWLLRRRAGQSLHRVRAEGPRASQNYDC
jgi:glycosyltransferase involved in cell wall biosynthesis